jgi:hypothetical protein
MLIEKKLLNAYFYLMSLKIKTEQTNIEVPIVQDSEDKRFFNLNLGDLGTTQIQYPLPIIGNHFEEINNYDIYLFKNRFKTSERDVYQISVKNGSIAFMLPLSIYDSEFEFNSDISQYAQKLNLQKKHNLFLKMVAYPVFHKLLLAEKTPSKIPNLFPDFDYKMLDFYDKDTNVLIVSKQRLQELNIIFDLDVYLPSLYKYGYVQLDTQEDFDDIYFNDSSRNPNVINLKIFDVITINKLSV